MRFAPHVLLMLTLAASSVSPGQTSSVARVWNEACLDAIRIDFPNPPVHARNLFHLSVAMYDAWASYETNAVGYTFNESIVATNLVAERHEAISYAAYRVLEERYALSVNATQTLADLGTVLTNLGYSAAVTTVEGTSPAAVGNRAAAAILDFSREDGSLQLGAYDDPSYAPVNAPLILALDDGPLNNPNRWQPLAFDFAITQNGLEADLIQSFVGAQWWKVRPFAMTRASETHAYYDPGPPPQVGGPDEAEYKTNWVQVLYYSSLLDPDSGEVIDTSPAGPGKNNTLGTQDGTGHPLNPVTGQPYATNAVPLGDFGRVVAEYWADGPDSETPPGHWNALANEVADHPLSNLQFEGSGPPLDRLEWDVKMYFALNAALHDAATAAWTAKRLYDYIRPVSALRAMARAGQCSDPLGPSYNPNGIPLVSNLVEVISLQSSASGERHAHLAGNLGQIAVHTWPGEPADPETQYSGRAWILGRNWLPYQRATFVTPAFPGYVSGHSTFSRAAAVVLAEFTGSDYFPGGLGVHTAAVDSLEFELGPSTNIVLQWATYYDAADEAGLSRLYGGIHPPVDDFPGRILGQQVGDGAYALARQYFDGSILDAPVTLDLAIASDTPDLLWSQTVGMQYRVSTTTNLLNFSPQGGFVRATNVVGAATVSNVVDGVKLLRVERLHE